MVSLKPRRIKKPFEKKQSTIPNAAEKNNKDSKMPVKFSNTEAVPFWYLTEFRKNGMGKE